ncbi:MAG: ABC transporter ATP-binding protein [Acidobacteriota bacterium]|nr:ABC transporter ATP-binding protein [Acidobacteriota bacterium]
MSVLACSALAVGYRSGGHETRLVEVESLTLETGELVCLLGPNGAGKSTLVRSLAGMQPPLQGEVVVHGDPLFELSARELARRVGVVLTERVDVGALDVRALVSLGRYPHTGWRGNLSSVDVDRIDDALRLVDAEDLADREVRTLSDGERQRVLIARALAQEPRLLVLDEPTAYLDLPRRIQTLGLLRRLTRERDIAVLLVTHHLDLALSHGDRVWLLPIGGPLEVRSTADESLASDLGRTFGVEELAGAREEVEAALGLSVELGRRADERRRARRETGWQDR